MWHLSHQGHVVGVAALCGRCIKKEATYSRKQLPHSLCILWGYAQHLHIEISVLTYAILISFYFSFILQLGQYGV